MIIPLLSLFIGSYLLGAIPFGLLVAKSKGVDIRATGSGNIGATNVGRVLGKKWGILVFVLDAAKGAAATIAASVLIHRGMLGDMWILTCGDFVWLGAGACAVLGHMYPIYTGFKGGKGVASSLGAIFGVYPYLSGSAALALLLWGLVVKSTGYVSLASILAAWSVPVWFVVIALIEKWPLAEHTALIGLCVVLSILITYRHRANLARIRSGTENKVGKAESRTKAP
jgi:acyl phosphate:glycerol-3-phosphate acyltransferase